MQRFRTGDHAFVREMNISSVLRYIYTSAPLSRSQIANLTGLNKSTVSSLVSDLLERQLVHQVGIESSRTGRPAEMLEINPDAGCIVGAAFGVDYISVILTTFNGNIQFRRLIEIDEDLSFDSCMEASIDLINEAIQFGNSCGQRALGIGLALPGMVDTRKGLLKFSPNLQWRDVPIGEIFKTRTGLPVFVDNDANAAAMGEHLFGLARQIRDFIFIVAGIGIGGGLFLDGKLYRGCSGIAGEIGHTSIEIGGDRFCRCGNRGCWENFGNQYALIERVRARLEVGRPSLISQLINRKNDQLSLDMIARAAQSGDVEVLEALEENGAAIGLGIANLVNIFDPEMVILGGSLSVVGEYMLPAIRAAVHQSGLNMPRPEVLVGLSAFGSDASVMGAVALVVEVLLADPTQIAIVANT
jgi:glucokinase-like ROK family protein